MTLSMVFKKSTYLFLGAGISACLLTWWAHSYHIDIWWAQNGFIALPWIYSSMDPISYSQDFLSSMRTFDKALFVHIYKFAYTFWDIAPVDLNQTIILLEIICVALAANVLHRSIIPGTSKVRQFVFIVLVIASFARFPDLGRYGEPFFLGFYNNFPNALRILAIAMVLRKRYVTAGVFLAMSFAGHSVQGLIAGIFIMAMMSIRPKAFFAGDFLKGFFVLAFLSVLWLLTVYDFSPDNASAGIPDKIWFSLALICSHHLFPVEMGVFTNRNPECFVPLISFIILLSFHFIGRKSVTEIDRKVIAGLVAMVALTVIGVLISYLKPAPFLVKLSLHRGSVLFLFVGLVYVLEGAWNDIESDKIYRKIFSFCLIGSVFIFRSGLPILYTYLFVVPILIKNGFEKDFSKSLYLTILIILISFGLLIYYFSAGYVGAWAVGVYTGGRVMLKLLLIALCLGMITLFRQKIKSYDMVNRRLPLLILLGLCAWSMVNRNVLDRIPAYDMSVAKSYKETQEWAKDHTSRDALFMVDPSIYYGWREFSQRSSFGNLREWLHTGWAYSSNYQVYKKGLERFQEFGIPLKPYLDEKYERTRFSMIESKVLDVFYSQDDQWRVGLSKNHGVDYFVFKKRLINFTSKMPIVYENDRFLVLGSEQTGDYTIPPKKLIISYDFLDMTESDVAWSTMPYGSQAPDWGIYEDTENNKKGLYIKQETRKNFWLYTGKGPIDNPPGDFEENSGLFYSNKVSQFRMISILKGQGLINAYIWWFGTKDKGSINLGRIRLSEKYKEVTFLFTLPPETKNIRISFLLRHNREIPKKLYVNHVRIEK